MKANQGPVHRTAQGQRRPSPRSRKGQMRPIGAKGHTGQPGPRPPNSKPIRAQFTKLQWPSKARSTVYHQRPTKAKSTEQQDRPRPWSTESPHTPITAQSSKLQTALIKPGASRQRTVDKSTSLQVLERCRSPYSKSTKTPGGNKKSDNLTAVVSPYGPVRWHGQR